MTYTKQPLDLITRLRMSYAGKYRPLQVEAADAIEALQAECAEHKENAMRNARIAVSIRAERDQLQAKLGDAIQSSAHWQHQCTELQAENERLKDQIDGFVNGQNQLFEVAKILEAERDQLQSQLDELRAVICGVGIVGKIAGHDVIVRESVIDLIDRRRNAANAVSESAIQPHEGCDSLGIPLSCGKPLCSPKQHHPLCKEYVQPQTPYANCRFRICDLPGQCKGDGKCHHPAVAQAQGEASKWVDVQKRTAIAQAVHAAIRKEVPGLGPWSAFDADEAQRIVDAIAHPQATEPAWRPIETAPKDGTVIDLWHEEFGRWASCSWGLPEHTCGEAGSICDDDVHSMEEGWVTDLNEITFPANEYTHWMPLPAAPEAKQ